MSRIKTGIMTTEDSYQNQLAKDDKKFISRLGVFKITNGIRPTELSAIVGPSGNGKSTLCKTISLECAISGNKCYHLLSEEKTSVYKSAISEALLKASEGKNIDKFLNKLLFESMLDWKKEEMTLKYFLSYLEKVIDEQDPDMIIIDNFTTSFLGSLPISQQGDAIVELRKIAAFYEIAIIAVFHTVKGTDIYKKVLDGEDVRGNASSTNAGAYNYIITTYFRGDTPRVIVNLDKARYHKEANKTYWELYFEKDLGIYTKDQKRKYEDVKMLIDDINDKAKRPPRKKEGRDWSL